MPPLVDDVGLEPAQRPPTPGGLIDDVGLEQGLPAGTPLWKVLLRGTEGPEGLADAARYVYENPRGFAASGVRMGGQMLGGAAGGLLTAETGPGAIAGAMGGAGAGAAAVEPIAQMVEGRPQISYGEMIPAGIAGGVSAAVPGGGAVRGAVQGAIFGAGEEAGRQYMREGSVDLGQVGNAALDSAIFGGAISSVLHGAGGNRGRGALVDDVGLEEPHAPAMSAGGLIDDVGLEIPETVGGGPREGSRVVFPNRPLETQQPLPGFGGPQRPRPGAPSPEAAAPAPAPPPPPENIVGRSIDDGAASPEAQNRVRSEARGGIEYFKIDQRSGQARVVPNITDRVDILSPGPHDVVVRVDPGGVRMVDRGAQVQPQRAQSVIDVFRKQRLTAETNGSKTTGSETSPQTEQPQIAVQLADGRILTEPGARTHAEILEAHGVDAGEVASTGALRGDEYRALKQPGLAPAAEGDAFTQRGRNEMAEALDVKPRVRGPAGGEVTAYSPRGDGQQFGFRYRAVELEDLTPLTKPGETQPRNRQRAAAQQQVQELARNMDPGQLLAGNEFLDRGVPIIGPDGAIEGGNGRVAALRLVQRSDPRRFAELMEAIKARAPQYGFQQGEVAAMRNPIIVRERVTDVPDRFAFAELTNEAPTLSSSPAENAANDARRVSPASIAALEVGDTQTVEQALLSPRNRGVVAEFMQSFAPNERNAISTGDGATPNPQGLQRIKAALLARTYPGEDGARLVQAATESADTGVRNVEAGIFGSLGKVARVRELVDAGARDRGLDPTADIAAATRKLAQLRSEGTPVDVYLRQQSFLGDELSPAGKQLLEYFDQNARSGRRIRDYLNAVADEVLEAPDPGQRGFGFGGDRLELGEVLERAKQRVGRTVGDLFNNQRGSIEPPRTLYAAFTGVRDRLRKIREEGERRNFQRAARAAGAEPSPQPSAQQVQLRNAPQGAARAPIRPLPGEGVLVDQYGVPLVQRGELSARNPNELAPSFSKGLQGANSLEQLDQLRRRIAEGSRDQVQFARRGRVSIEEQERGATKLIAELADRFGQTPDEFVASLRKQGEAVNAETARAIDTLGKRAGADAVAAAAKARKTGRPEDLAAAHRAYAKAQALIVTDAGARAEGGRTLNAYRNLSGPDANVQKALRYASRLAGGEEHVRQVVDWLGRLDPNDVRAINRFLREVKPATVGDKLYELWINALLSGPQTHVVNTISNTLTALERLPERVGAAGIDLVRAATTGTKRERFFGEVLADAVGMVHGLRNGLRGGLQAALTEEPTFGASKFDPDVRQHAIKGATGRLVRAPGALLLAADEVFKAVNFQGELYARAYRQASKEGLRGRARARRMERIISNPDSIYGLRTAAEAEALYRTFQSDPGRFGRAVLNLRESSPIMSVIIPFVRTPLNIAKFGVERTPLNLLNVMRKAARGELKGGELSEHVARAAIGTAIAAVVASYVAQDVITGGGPRDPSERRQWLLTHKPYSVKVGGTWYPYGRLEPLGITVGLVADGVTIFNQVEKESFTWKAGTAIATALGTNLANKTFLRGISDLMAAISDPDRSGAEWIQGLAGTLVPTGVAQTASAADPTMRRPRTIADVFSMRLGMAGSGEGARAAREAINPWSEKIGLHFDEVGPIRDVWGQPISRQGLFDGAGGAGAFADRLLNPISPLRPQSDPASVELSRLQAAGQHVSLGTPRQQLTIHGKPWQLDPKAYDQYVELAGAEAKRAVTDLVRSDVYRRLPDEGKAELLEKRYDAARARVRERMRGKVLRGELGASRAAAAGR